MGGDGNATGCTTYGCPGLLIMGSPSQGHIPSVMDQSFWKCFLAMGPSIKLHDVTESKLMIRNLLEFQNGNQFCLGNACTCDPQVEILRTVMCCLVALANNCVWVIEQPSNSLAGQWHRLDWLVNHVAWVLWYWFIKLFFVQQFKFPCPL